MLGPRGAGPHGALAQAQLTAGQRRWILALLLVAFGLKLPIAPLHGWQPFSYAESPIPVVMLLSGVVSKLGAYGLLRFGVGFLGDTWVACAQMLAHGLIVALLFACVGLIERKTGTSTIAELSGLMNPLRGLPLTLALLLLALMAAAGIPGLAGFPAELLVFVGSWSAFPQATLVALVSSGFTAVYAVRLFNRVGFGRLDNQRADWPLTSWAERAPLLLLAGLVVATGLWPRALTGWSETTTASLALRPLAPAAWTLTSPASAANAAPSFEVLDS